jgi:hypothetical protein
VRRLLLLLPSLVLATQACALVLVAPDGKTHPPIEHVSAAFGPGAAKTGPGLTLELATAVPANGCGAVRLVPSGIGGAKNQHTRRAVLVLRGGCDFYTKTHNVQQAGGGATIVYNSADGENVGAWPAASQWRCVC